MAEPETTFTQEDVESSYKAVLAAQFPVLFKIPIQGVALSASDKAAFETKANTLGQDWSDALSPAFAQAIYPYISGGGGEENTALDALALESEFNTGYPSYYKELVYDVNDNISVILFYNSSSKETQLFSKEFFYTGDNLTSTILTRVSDNKKLKKEFGYSSSDMIVTINITVYTGV